jgi:hypothetical protein
MNLWRVPIEERSGRVLGAPEPITTPSPYSGYLSFSRDGTLLAYADVISSTEPQKIGFDAVKEKSVGQSLPVTIPAGAGLLSPSPDGRWLAFVSGRNQDDIFVVRTDGTELRQLTDDTYRDMNPRWFPDSKTILFYSNRSGRYQVWTINADGSGLSQLTEAADEMWYAVLSPDAKRVAAFDSRAGRASVFDATVPWNEQSPQLLPALDEPDSVFLPSDWSLDGRRLAGSERMADGRIQGILLYSFEERRFEKLSCQAPMLPGQGSQFSFCVWLRDSRHLMFPAGDKLNLIDSRSGEINEILCVSPHSIGDVSVSADNKTIYFILKQEEGDIWLASLK